MDKRQKKSPSVWDAERLVKEYVKIEWCVEWCKGHSFKSLSWSNQIRVRRVASALSAYMETAYEETNPARLIDTVFGQRSFYELFAHSELEDDDHEQLLSLMRKALADNSRYQFLMRLYRQNEERDNHSFRRRNSDRGQMLHFLLEFRIKAEKLLSCFSGVLEASHGGALAIDTIKSLYFPSLQAHNDKADEMIVLLLGSKFKRTFSEDELNANYGYPKETDDELLDWEADNF